MTEYEIDDERQVEVRTRTVVYTYALLWHAAQHTLQIAEAQEIGRTYTLLASAMLAAFSIEAYLNHVGEMKSDTWRLVERKLSPEDKLFFLATDLGFNVDLGSSPFSTFKELFRLRNLIAHGRTERRTEVIQLLMHQTIDHGFPQSTIDKEFTLDRVRRLVLGAKVIVEELNKLSGINDEWWLWNAQEVESSVSPVEPQPAKK